MMVRDTFISDVKHHRGNAIDSSAGGGGGTGRTMRKEMLILFVCNCVISPFQGMVAFVGKQEENIPHMGIRTKLCT